MKMSGKKKKSKHNNPTKGVFIAIDETSNYVAEYYVMVAAVTKDRRAYRDIVENMDLDFEIGFSSDKELAPTVLCSAADVIETIYAAYIPKDSANRYEELLTAINDAIPYDPSKGLLVMIDANDELNPRTVERIFKTGKKGGSQSAVVVVPSNFFCEMQTHDFVTGAVGAKINHENGKWMKHLSKVDINPIKLKNCKRETSPTETPCPLAGLRVLPLRGQITGAYPNKYDTGIKSENPKGSSVGGTQKGRGLFGMGRTKAEKIGSVKR